MKQQFTGSIDPRSVPHQRISWPAAYRLRPCPVPSSSPAERLGEEAVHMEELRLLTAPSERHLTGAAPLACLTGLDANGPILKAFACPLPEWRFAFRGLPHIIVADKLDSAISVAAEIYTPFLRDTAQAAMRMNFIVERFSLQGDFADISDRELFPACYKAQDWKELQALVSDIASCGRDGVVYACGLGHGAVVLDGRAVSYREEERALCLEWNGSVFEHLYDYRLLQWRACQID